MELTLGEKIIRIENNYRNVESSALRQLLMAKNNDSIVKYGRQVSREYDLKSPILAQCIHVGDKISAAIEKKNILFHRKQLGLPASDATITDIDELPSKQELIANFNQFQANQFDFTSNIYSNNQAKKDQNLGIAYKNLGKWSLKSVEVEKELKQLLSTSNDELPTLNSMLILKGLCSGMVETLIKCSSNETSVIGKEEMCNVTSHFKHSSSRFEIVQGTYVSNNIDALITTLSKQGNNSTETDTCALLKAYSLDNKIHIRPLCNVSDILLAAEELFETNSPFIDGCITMPKVLPKLFKRVIGSYFRYRYILNKPGQWYHIHINLPKGLVYGTTIRQLACPLVFSTEYMEINPVSSHDIDVKLVESCDEILKRIKNMYNNDMLLSEMRLDFEPCYISTKVNKNESKNKYFYRLFHTSHCKYLERNTSCRRNAVGGVHSLIKERLLLFAKIFKNEKKRIVDLKYNRRSAASIDEMQGADIESIHLHSLARNMAVKAVGNKQCDDETSIDDYDSDEVININDIYDDGLNEYPLDARVVVHHDNLTESTTTEFYVDPILIEIAKKKYYKSVKDDSEVYMNAASSSRVLTPCAKTPIEEAASRHQRPGIAKAATQYGLLTPEDADNVTVITVDKFLKLWNDICEQEYAYSRELDAIMHRTKYAGNDELNDIIYNAAANNPLDTLFENASTIAQDIRARLSAKYGQLDDAVENEDDKYRLEFNQTCDQAMYSILQGLSVDDVGYIMNRLRPKPKKKKKCVVADEPAKKQVEKKSRIVKRTKKEILATSEVAIIIEEIKKPTRKYVEVPVYVRREERPVPVVNAEERNLLLRRRMEIEAELLAIKAARAKRLRQSMLKALMSRFLHCMHLPKVTLDGKLLEEESLLEELHQIELERNKEFYYLHKESKNLSVEVGGSLWNSDNKPMLDDGCNRLSASATKNILRKVLEVIAATFVNDIVSISIKSMLIKDAANVESIVLVDAIIDKVTECIGTIATVSDDEYIIISDPIDVMILTISQESNALASETIYKALKEEAGVEKRNANQMMKSIELTDSVTTTATLIEEDEFYEPFDDDSVDSRENESLNALSFNVDTTLKRSMSIALPDESMCSEYICIPNDGDSIAGSSIPGWRDELDNDAPVDILTTIAHHFVKRIIYECLSCNLEIAFNAAEPHLKIDNGIKASNNAVSSGSWGTSGAVSSLSIIAVAIPVPITERRNPHKTIESRQIVMAGVYNDEKKRRSKSDVTALKITTGQYLSFLDPIYTENGVAPGLWMPSLAAIKPEVVVATDSVKSILDEFKPSFTALLTPHPPVASARKESKVIGVAWKRKSTKAMKVLTENIKKVSIIHGSKHGATIEDPFLYTGDDRYGVVNSITNEKLVPTTTRIVPPAVSSANKSDNKDNLFTLSMIDYYISEQRRLLDTSIGRSADNPEVTCEQRILSDIPELLASPGFEKIWNTKPVYNIIRTAARGKASLSLNDERGLTIAPPRLDTIHVLEPLEIVDVAGIIEDAFTNNIFTATPFNAISTVHSIVKNGDRVTGLHNILMIDKMNIGFSDPRVANPSAVLEKEAEAPEVLISHDSVDVLHPRPPTVSHSSRSKSPRAEIMQVSTEPEVPGDIKHLVIGSVSEATSRLSLQSPLLPRIGNKSPLKSVNLSRNRMLLGKPQIGKHMQAEGYKVLRGALGHSSGSNGLKVEEDELSYQVSVQEIFDSYFTQKYGQSKYDTGDRRYDSVGERTYTNTNNQQTQPLLNLSREGPIRKR